MTGWLPAEIASLRDMAIGGRDTEHIAVTLKRRQSDVREMAALLGLQLDAFEALEWCDRCCSPRSQLDPLTGWCLPCTARWRAEQQRIADEEEERRLREEATREVNQVKKARQRMREQYGANPRKSTE